MKRHLLFSICLVFCMVFTSSKPAEVNPYRVFPYLQVYGNGKIQITWFGTSQSTSSIKLINETGGTILEQSVVGEEVSEIFYTSQEKNENIPGLSKGSWLKSDAAFRYRFQADLPAGKSIAYTVTLAGVKYSGSFITPPAKDSWEKIRFMALADSETDPKGRITHRAWYPGKPLFRPFAIPQLWREKFGTTTEQGIELPNYMLTEERGYAENLKIIDSRDPDFILMPGDLVQGAGYQPAWDEFFRHNAGELGNGISHYPIIPALGNWEAYGGINGGYGNNENGTFLPLLGRSRFHEYFQTPSADPLQKHRQSYYRVDYGPVTILTVDSSNGTPDQTPADFAGQTKLKGKEFTVPGTDTQENYTQAQYNAAGGKDLSGFGPGSDQYKWLEENLKDASEAGQLIFVQYHHAAYSSGEHGVPLNHELSVGQVGTPMRILNPILEEYGVIAVLSGHDELFERSFVDEDGDGKGILYYDVGVAGDGMRGEKRDWLGNPLNTLNYNTYRQWTADQSEPEIWNTSGANPILTDGGKHYGHLEVNLTKVVEGNQEYALIDFLPVYAFPVMDQNYNLTKVERRVYNDEVKLKIPLRKNAALPVFKEELKVYLNENGEALPETSDYFSSGYLAEYKYQFSRDPNFSCADLGTQEVKLKVFKGEDMLTEGVARVTVVDETPPKLEVKSYTSVIDIVTNKSLELKPEFFVKELSDNCGEDLEVSIVPQTLGCGDFNTVSPVEVQIRVTDKSGNYTDATTSLTVEAKESKQISLNGPSEGIQGESVKLTLGSEFPAEIEGWYRGNERISSSSAKELTVDQPGVYKALVRPLNGCPVYSESLEVTFKVKSDLPKVKDKIEISLNEAGQVKLENQQIFSDWPIDGSYTVSLSKSEFTCNDLGAQVVTVNIKDGNGNAWEEKIEVIVQDNAAPDLQTKAVEVELNLTKGELELKPEDFIASLSDNCGIKSLHINKTKVNCEDVGKEITVELRAEDQAGNVTEKTAKLSIKGVTDKPVILTGLSSICAGEQQVLELASDADFEVVRWRRNGNEISGQTTKTLEIEEGGVYHAVIRYAGGCLYETGKIEIETIAKPSGEIETDGNILRAPAGEFEYRWFRNGELIPEEMTRELTVSQSGKYTVELTNNVGCKRMLEGVEIAISGILNPGILVSEELNIYPNPASSEVEIQALGDLEFAENSMRIYNSTGKEVSSSVEVIRQSSGSVRLAISRLAAGTYVVMLESLDSRVFVGKLIKR